MRFPLRLSVDLMRASVSRRLSGGSASPIFRLAPHAKNPVGTEPADDLPTEIVWPAPEECARLAESRRAPVVWLGGAEPMLHPEIGEVASALASAGRHVFVHTLGAGLRKRIHEFAPSSQLFLTLEFAGLEAAHDKVAGQGTFRRTLEGIRAAKLSGFLVCAHVTVTEESDPAEIGQLFEFLDTKDVDGFVVSSGGKLVRANELTALRDKLAEARSMVRCSRWSRFSEMLESSYALPAAEKDFREVRGGEANACEESA